MHRRYLPLILSFLLFGPCFPAAAQEYSYVDYTVKDGLAGSTVYAMARDKDGFLWFGTETGLSRWDGSHFRNFYMTDGLPDNEIIKLFVDSRNRVWIAPFKNSLCYYQNGKIHNQQNDSLLRKLNIRNEVFAVTEDVNGNLVIAEFRKIDVVGPDGKVSTIDSFNGGSFLMVQMGHNAKGECQFLLVSNSGFVATLEHGVLIGTNDIPDAGGNNYTSTYLGPELMIYEDRDSLRFLYRGENGQVRIPAPKGFLHISRIDDSSLTLNAYSSTYLYNIRQRKITDSFLPGQMVSGALEDPGGGIWFSTLGGGIHRLVTRDVIQYAFREGNTVFPITAIRRVGNTLYAGADRFCLWSRKDGDPAWRSRKIDYRLSRGRITAIEEIGGKEIVAGTDAGLFGIAMTKGGSREYWHHGAVKALWKLSDSVIIEFSGLDVRKMRLRDGVILDTIFARRSTCGWVQGDHCYVGTLTGLYSIPLSGKTAPRELLKTRISALAAAQNGGLWVGTYGEGIVLWKDGKEVKRFTVEDGLTSNICKCLYVAGSSLWVGTNKGLNKIGPADSGYAVTPFTVADGLGSEIINTVYVDRGTVYAGTPDGMTLFPEDRIFRRTECKLRITGLRISGSTWPLDTVNFKLPFNDNDLQVEYAGISYRGSGPIHYRYRLLGTDRRWETTDQNFLHYPSLPPGQYELQILAINPSGAISSTLRLPFSIDQPWWEWIWVRGLLGIAMGGLVWLIFQRRVRAIRHKEEEKTRTAARMAELEQMALRSRMNPHFIFNSLNSIQLFVMEKDIRGANEYITHFSRLIRQTLDISAKAQISLEEEVHYLSTYLELEKGRFEEAFGYDIFVDAGIDKRMHTLPPMILQPYVENAVLHGIAHRADRQGRITISFRTNGKHLICIIEDNGVGRKRAAQFKDRGRTQYPSRGMEMTARRIDILNSTMKEPIDAVIEDVIDEGGQGEGTRVVVRFPL